MKGYEYITAKQIEWANNRGISLIGSQVDRGRLSYVRQLDENLFQPLLPEVREAFIRGRGDELGLRSYPGKMQAVHSSSALGVNVFQYWLSLFEVPVVAAACGLCRAGSSAPCELRFEEQYPVNDAFESPPHIDIVIHNRPDARIQRLAIECKFSEAYSFKHPGIKERYLAECVTLWDGIPNLRNLAESLCPDDTTFQHLHAAFLRKVELWFLQPTLLEKLTYTTHRDKILYTGPEKATILKLTTSHSHIAGMPHKLKERSETHSIYSSP